MKINFTLRKNAKIALNVAIKDLLLRPGQGKPSAESKHYNNSKQ